MRLPKILVLLVGLTIAAVSPAAEYSLEAAVEAGGKMVPKDGPAEVALYNLPSPGGKDSAKQLLGFLRAGRRPGVYLMLTTAKNKYARDLLAEAMKQAKKKEKFTGVHLIIAGDRVEPAMFEAVLKDRDMALLHAAY